MIFSLVSLDYHEELEIFNEKVMPLLVEMGLRNEIARSRRCRRHDLERAAS
jgi:hypothetical protein